MAIIGEIFAKVADECAKDEGVMREYREEYNRLEKLKIDRINGEKLINYIIGASFSKPKKMVSYNTIGISK